MQICHLINSEFIFATSLVGFCNCMDNGINTKIELGDGLRCCMKANDTCSGGDSEDDLDGSTFGDEVSASLFAEVGETVNCSGTSLSLNRRCNTDNSLAKPCNYYPQDPFRGDSSSMDICLDQR